MLIAFSHLDVATRYTITLAVSKDYDKNGIVERVIHNDVFQWPNNLLSLRYRYSICLLAFGIIVSGILFIL